MKNETVTISKQEYLTLLEDSEMLEALRAAGVDNWEGFNYAVEIFQEEQEGGT